MNIQTGFRTLHSVLGNGMPIDPYFQPSNGVVCVAGLASDIPYPAIYHRQTINQKKTENIILGIGSAITCKVLRLKSYS